MSQMREEVSQWLDNLIESREESRAALDNRKEEVERFVNNLPFDRHLESYEQFGESNIVPILFMDIVGYSKLKLDDDQKQAIELLNRLVKQALAEGGYDLDHVVCLPTGDGMCLCFIRGSDGPLVVGGRVQELLAEHRLK